jgi:hypothetical protein
MRQVPVLRLDLPVPSRLRVTVIWVSLVSRLTVADRGSIQSFHFR